jgi:hypothetical protein
MTRYQRPDLPPMDHNQPSRFGPVPLLDPHELGSSEQDQRGVCDCADPWGSNDE